MRKIIVVISVLVMFLFLVSCAPQITDEELEVDSGKSSFESCGFVFNEETKAELSKLKPEEACKETDNGKNPFTKGYTSGFTLDPLSGVLTYQERVEDFCLNKDQSSPGIGNCTGEYCYVVEQYCCTESMELPAVMKTIFVGDGDSNLIKCKFGCQDGACLSGPAPAVSKTVIQTK